MGMPANSFIVSLNCTAKYIQTMLISVKRHMNSDIIAGTTHVNTESNRKVMIVFPPERIVK